MDSLHDADPTSRAPVEDERAGRGGRRQAEAHSVDGRHGNRQHVAARVAGVRYEDGKRRRADPDEEMAALEEELGLRSVKSQASERADRDDAWEARRDAIE